MKKIILATGVLLVSCVLATSLYVPAVSAENQSIETATVEITDSGYIVKAENGIIVVYAKGDKIPIMVTDTRVATLPEEDRLRLEQGIELNSRKELYKTIEDYCS